MSLLDVHAAAAKSAGLRYVNDDDPGLSREARRGAFVYRDAQGRLVRDADTLARIKRLAIPPAWTEVWISPHENGHIQATGRDARRRKQYRYHPDWRSARDETKYERMVDFGRALPGIRRRVARDLKRTKLDRTRVLATVVRLLESTLIRIGNEEYVQANGSVGLTTLRDRHVRIKRGTLHFDFKGKSGQRHHIELHDPQLAGIVRRTQDLPGQILFQYLDDDGSPQRITSDDVNGYLREIAGDEFSAKDFRTWAGTVLAALALRQFERFTTKAEAKRNLVAAIERVAERLGNTPAVCRKCYIHPVVLDSYLAGATVEVLLDRAEDVLAHGLAKLTGFEGAVLAFLQTQLRRLRQPPLLTALRKSVQQTRIRRPAQRRDARRVRGTSDGARAAARSPGRRSLSSARRS